MCIGSKSFPLFCPYRDGIIWLKVLVLGTANSCKQLQMGAFWNGWYCLVLGLWGSSPVSSTKREALSLALRGRLDRSEAERQGRRPWRPG